MTRTDTLVVGTLVVAARDPRGPHRCPGHPTASAAGLGVAIGRSGRAAASRSRPYVEGVVGAPVSVAR